MTEYSIKVIDCRTNTVEDDPVVLLKAAQLSSGEFYHCIGMQDDGTAIVFTKGKRYGILPARYRLEIVPVKLAGKGSDKKS